MMASATRPRSTRTEPLESPASAVWPTSSNRAPPQPGGPRERGQVVLKPLDPADRGRVERIGILHHHEPGGAAGSGQHRVEPCLIDLRLIDLRLIELGRRAGQAGRPGDLRDTGLSRQFVLQPGQRRGLPGHARADDQDLGGRQDTGREAVRRCGTRPRGRSRRGKLPDQR
jgi:hypothetical protein